LFGAAWIVVDKDRVVDAGSLEELARKYNCLRLWERYVED
jgi:hypothetical protein